MQKLHHQQQPTGIQYLTKIATLTAASAVRKLATLIPAVSFLTVTNLLHIYYKTNEEKTE